MNYLKYRLIIFLGLNFTALMIGGLFTGQGVSSSWYNNLNQAPWLPPSWMFGVAWTTIMIAFAFYMSFLLDKLTNSKRVLQLYLLQLILNIAWNPAFFYLQNTGLALIVICLLTILVSYFLFRYFVIQGYSTLLILPYFLWLLVATSLNAYIFIAN